MAKNRVTETCSRCGGTGMVKSILEDVEYRCGGCGGHKVIPVRGEFTFYKPMEKGFSHLTQQIAVVMEEDEDIWRVTFFRPNGPSSHIFEKREAVFGELRSFFISEVAGKMLDFWSTTPVWAHGIKQLQWVAYQNLLCSIAPARQELYKLMDEGPSLDKLLGAARKLKNEYAPEAELW